MSMEPLLYLVHRMPYPPNKGDKLRSHHLLRFLAARYQVHLGTFVDDDADLAHVDALRQWCASVHVARLDPGRARVRSLAALATGEALTLRYYRDPGLARWVRATVREAGIERAVAFSGVMAHYALTHPELRVVVDFVDVDSAKWRQYGAVRRFPVAQLYRREARRLLAFERAAAGMAAASVFVTPGEADLFISLAPECAERVHVARNGVDTAYFDPSLDLPSPYAPDEQAIVFSGAMDYWPNVDAACAFAREVLPLVRAARPQARFYAVGMNPAPAVQALAADAGVTITGRVPDVRPFLKHARAVVAPLRVARGIQNKVLEAMAMARPLVVSRAVADSLSGTPGRHFAVGDTPAGFAAGVLAALDDAAMGREGRAHVVAHYDWETNLLPFAELLRGPAPAGSARPQSAPLRERRAAHQP